ncbi:hypothetical protein ACFSZS_30500 [Seohaeicola zhoushanensis]
MDGIAACAVIGLPDPTYGEQVHAVLVPKPGAELDLNAIRAACREKIAGYKVPRGFTLRTEPLPLSGAGKVLKSDLKKR